MRIKKKILYLRDFLNIRTAVLFGAVLLSLTGCGAKEEAEKEAAPAGPDYVIGVEADNAPYYAADASGNVSGLYVDLMDCLAENAGCTYAFQTMSAAEFDAMGGEGCDVFLGTMEPAAGSLSDYVQTEPFCQTGLSLLVKEGTGMSQMSDLRDRTIASRADTGEEAFAGYLAARYDGETIVFPDGTEALGDLTGGYASAVVMDAGNAAARMQEDPGLQVLKTSEKYFSFHRLSAATDRGIPEELAAALAQMQTDGTMAALLQQYGLG